MIVISLRHSLPFSAFLLFLPLDRRDLQGGAQAWVQGLCLEGCGWLWRELVGDSGAWLQRTSQDRCDLHWRNDRNMFLNLDFIID